MATVIGKRKVCYVPRLIYLVESGRPDSRTGDSMNYTFFNLSEAAADYEELPLMNDDL